MCLPEAEYRIGSQFTPARTAHIDASLAIARDVVLRGRAMTMFIFPARAAGTRLVAPHFAIDCPLLRRLADKRVGGIRPGRGENRLEGRGNRGGGARGGKWRVDRGVQKSRCG